MSPFVMREEIDFYHDALWKIRLGQHDSAELLEHADQNSIFSRGVECAANISKGGVIPLNIELIFQSDGDTVEWPDHLSMLSLIAIKLAGLCQSL